MPLPPEMGIGKYTSITPTDLLPIYSSGIWAGCKKTTMRGAVMMEIYKKGVSTARRRKTTKLMT